MKFLEGAWSFLRKVFTIIYLLLTFTLAGGVLGVIAHELIENTKLKIIVLVAFILLGLVVGTFVSIDSRPVNLFNFISKLNATNELDAPDKVDRFYSDEKR